jgi:hypothetical protein
MGCVSLAMDFQRPAAVAAMDGPFGQHRLPLSGDQADKIALYFNSPK